MAATTALTDEQVAEALALMKGADSVELKLTVPADSQRTAVKALDIDPLDAQIRQVFFFDTPELTLNASGVVVRARRVQGKGDDTVVKLRPVVPQELPEELRLSPSFGVEVDAMPGGFVCSGSFKGALPEPRVRETVGGDRPLRKLFSKEQRAFYAQHAPEGIALEDLSVLGPIFVLKVKFSPRDARAEGRRRAVALPGRLAPARALDQVRAGRGVPGRRRDARLPDRARHRHVRGTGDEDPQGARVLRGAAGGRRRRRVTAPPPAPRRNRPTTWIVLTVALGAAVIGLAIWAAVLQSDQDDVNAASAAQIEELEQENAQLTQQVADLEQQLADAQADAEAAATEAQAQLDAAQEQYESVAAELGSTNTALADSQAELERLADEADAALEEAEGATASAEQRAQAQQARAELAEACLAAVADVLQRIYAADDPAEALDEAADDLEQIAEDCDQAA